MLKTLNYETVFGFEVDLFLVYILAKIPVTMTELKQEVSLSDIYKAKIRIDEFYQSTPCTVSNFSYLSSKRYELHFLLFAGYIRFQDHAIMAILKFRNVNK